MSTSLTAQAPRLTKTASRSAIYTVTNGAMSVLKTIYSTVKKFVIGFLDFAIEVQEVRDAAFKNFPYISHR